MLEVRKTGSRIKVILSRRHPELVLRLFETEIPEVSERIIEIRSVAREAGFRSKVAVSCIDTKIDPVGACVGVRGARIRNIVDELGGERIDIIRWNDSLQVLVPNAMQPAEVEDVILCPMLGRVIVLCRDDQLSLAIGKRGQNVRLASKLVGWDIEVMTQSELDEQLEKSVSAFSEIEGVTEDLAESLVSQGFFSFYDLSVIEPNELAELGGLTMEQCDAIVNYADEVADRLESEEATRKAEDAKIRAVEKAAAQMSPKRPVPVLGPAVSNATVDGSVEDETTPETVAEASTLNESVDAAGVGVEVTDASTETGSESTSTEVEAS